MLFILRRKRGTDHDIHKEIAPLRQLLLAKKEK